LITIQNSEESMSEKPSTSV